MTRRLEVTGTAVDRGIDLGDGPGQCGFADRDHRVGFAYLDNQMGGFGDARARELTLALRASIGA